MNFYCGLFGRCWILCRFILGCLKFWRLILDWLILGWFNIRRLLVPCIILQILIKVTECVRWGNPRRSRELLETILIVPRCFVFVVMLMVMRFAAVVPVVQITYLINYFIELSRNFRRT